jgi:hypothetical protein
LPDGQLLRYADGRPITHHRYDHLWTQLAPRSWLAVDGGHVRFVVAFAGGRGQVAEPLELVAA